jgi:hypothetical protein
VLVKLDFVISKGGEKGTIVLNYQLEKLWKVGGTFAKDKYVYHWWPLSLGKYFIGLGQIIHLIKLYLIWSFD